MAASSSLSIPTWLAAPCADVVPGLLVCLGVTGAALAIERFEAWAIGHAWLEALVLAILVGTVVRAAWTPDRRFKVGIGFCARTLLEVAIVLLGASLSATALIAAGPMLILGIAGVVAMSLIISLTFGRLLGLPRRMALLVACGNSICGNSAIAAAAPVIGADGDDVAASIAWTAVLGVVVVLGLPLLAPLFGLSDLRYGIFAGLTVYAVPQVLVATAPVSALSVQVGTLVKLVRVLMLGPVILALGLTQGSEARRRPPLSKLVPWFIVGFLAMMALRSFGWLPDLLLAPMASVASLLTVLAMAALGLTVDVRAVAGASLKVALAVILSLAALGGLSLTLLHLLPLA